MATAYVTIKGFEGFEVMRMIRCGHCGLEQRNVTGEIRLVNQVFDLAAQAPRPTGFVVPVPSYCNGAR